MRMATGVKIWASGAFARTVAIFALCVLSSGAYAGTCTPATPRLDPGTGFTSFGANEQVLARAGNKGPAWEWAVGTDTDSGQKVQGSLDWESGKEYAWKVVNSGTGNEVLEIRDAESLVLSLTYSSGMHAGNALELRVTTNPSIGPDTTIAASLTRLNGHAVSGSLVHPGTSKQSAHALYYYFPQMVQGFIAEGTVRLTYSKKRPSGSRVLFAVRAGTIPCNASANPPTVSITAPAVNSVLSAPATINVSAEAEDSDGTVTQVAFFANGNPIGTATSNPFTIQWTNVQPGIYNVTAIAGDNDGLKTTSTAIQITVNAMRALYFIHVDQLNAPRLIADATQKSVWQWKQQEPFGVDLANENLESDSNTFGFPQRFPGQFFDRETHLHYNYFRDFDPHTGRYVQSDPVGLTGGLNSYVYVANNPLQFFDPEGHDAYTLGASVNLLGVGGSAGVFVSFPGPKTPDNFDIGIYGTVNALSWPWSKLMGGPDYPDIPPSVNFIRGTIDVGYEWDGRCALEGPGVSYIGGLGMGGATFNLQASMEDVIPISGYQINYGPQVRFGAEITQSATGSLGDVFRLLVFPSADWIRGRF